MKSENVGTTHDRERLQPLFESSLQCVCDLAPTQCTVHTVCIIHRFSTKLFQIDSAPCHCADHDTLIGGNFSTVFVASRRALVGRGLLCAPMTLPRMAAAEIAFAAFLLVPTVSA